MAFLKDLVLKVQSMSGDFFIISLGRVGLIQRFTKTQNAHQQHSE